MNIWEYIAAWLYDYGTHSAGVASLRGSHEVEIPECLKESK